MLGSPWIAALIAIFSWWFFTGIILLIVRRKDVAGATAHGASVVLGVPLLALGIFGAVISSASLSVANIYLAFFSVLLIWGWIELAFLSGVITGPLRDLAPSRFGAGPDFAEPGRPSATTKPYYSAAWFSWPSSRLMLQTRSAFGPISSFLQRASRPNSICFLACRVSILNSFPNRCCTSLLTSSRAR